MTTLPSDLRALDVPPGPSRAVPLPADRPVRWGVLATGKIAAAVVPDLLSLEECEVVAVASRRQESADAFAARHGIRTAYGDYQSLMADPDVDVVYVASPHALHREHVELALEAGKPVLCEKPLTLTAGAAERLVTLARERDLFLMEAMWMRCNPVIRRLQQLVAAGVLGEVRQVHADIGFVVDRPPTDRLLDPALGGGALLDMGIYPLTLAHLFLGEPSAVAATAGLSDAGVDLDVALSLGYPGGAVASLSASMTSWPARSAVIATDRGRVDLAGPFYNPVAATWTPMSTDPERRPAGEPQQIGADVPGTGYTHQAREVVRCLRSGETESPLVPLDETLALMRLMDRIREQVGVRYGTE
jgi:predicted dehydrogenase